MGADWSILPVLAVIFLATLIRSAFGFGEALVAVPLLALLIPVEEAVPLATLVSITVAGVVVAQDWHKIHVRSAGWLVISTIFGIPLGLWLLTAIAETAVKAILA
ncbi:MAG TPA: TSUP family transporter, partial [Gemmataceae bacterium]|nr:TSUP family transporter [Gemmataceae bacterium]